MELEDLIETLKNLNEKKAAFTLLEALGRHAADFRQNDSVASNLFTIKKYRQAIPFAEKTVELASTPTQVANAKINLVNVLAHAYLPERALEIIDDLEKTYDPMDPDVRLKKAYALFLVGKRDDAEKILREELKNPRNDAKTINDIEFNLGTYELYKDNFHEGLYRFLIHGRKMNLWNKPKLPFTEWNGIPLPGKTLVIRTEAGIGDELINFRFMKLIKDADMHPIWFSERKETCAIFKRHGYDTASSLDELSEFNLSTRDIVWCHSMDMPVIMKLEYKDLWYGPYLKADATITDLPAELKTDKLKIGIRWQGNPDYDQDLHRSVPLNELYDVVKDVPNSVLFSLQRDTGADDVLEFPDVIPLYHNYLHTFENTMAIIDKLDVVITSCTSIAHAAAAMGKKTFVMTPMSSYYTWCHSMKQSPWYGDNVTILRQVRPRYWDEPLTELKQYLNDLYSN